MPPPTPILVPSNAMPAVWSDWMHLRETPCFLCTPADRHELVALMKTAPDLRALRLRARGSGHSSSDVGAPRRSGFLVDFHRFSLDHAAEARRWWKTSTSGCRPAPLRPDASLVRVKGSTTIAELNAMLAAEASPRALLNLGSYDAQTIAGAVATATHGTGLVSGPLCDFVSSIELVAVMRDELGEPEVVSLRIEPANGITDPAAFAQDAGLHRMRLLQDDDLFYSAVVGLGCFGIVTALTLQVVPAFSLEERRELRPWSEVRSSIVQRSDRDWFDFLVTALPLEVGVPDGHHCLLSWRDACAPGPGDQKTRNDARVAKLQETLDDKLHQPVTDPSTRRRMTAYLAKKGSDHPRFANRLAWQNAFEGEVQHGRDHQRARSHVMFRTSIGDYVYATSIEVVVPRARAVEAVDAAIAHAKAMHEQGYHHLSPFGVRFVRASPHYLAPEHDMESCTIEAPILLGARKQHKDESTSRDAIETMLRAFYDRFETWPHPARFHWGQRSFVDFADARRTYPKLPRWLEQLRRLSPFGTCDNEFTDRLGISV